MKRIIVGFALMLAPAVAVAQSTSPATATINTSAKVQSAVSFSSPVDLDFGSAIPGASAGVSVLGVSTTSGSLGSVLLSANQAVTVTAAYSALTGPGANLTATPACGWDVTSTPGTATAFSCTTGYASPAAGTGATGHTIFLGGSVALPAGQVAGTYSGTVTVSGTYTTY